uniref:Retrovirus-related Pol polyprotein from transposon TNT 1-94 n=1 Tax=Cajanus cajan TaxID=3821 RepID=A0A151R694_CAJCA|nr:hypothetical protein KK1_040748 [Cajanus cajan]
MYPTVLTCKCSPICSCDILLKIQKERDDDCVIKFLRGLNDEFAQVRSQVMLMEPMPGLTRTFSLVLQQEREFGNCYPQTPPKSAALTSIQNEPIKKINSRRGGFSNGRGGDKFGRGFGRNTKWCSKCKKTNHTIETCFKIYGFPAGYKTNSKDSSASSTPSANVADSNPFVIQESPALEVGSYQNNFGFSKEQCEALLALLQQSKDSSPNMTHAHHCSANSTGINSFPPSWILDSGAIDHICPSKSYFTTFHSIKPISI